MGKSKKTRWRTFEISGSQDETQTNGGDVKVNGTSSTESHSPVASQKYSQILGDHHTNSSTQFNRNSSHHIYKSRNSYNNKENFYNQRSGGRPGGGGQRSWQRSGNYRTSIVNGRDKKPEEGEKSGLNDTNVDSTAEPAKFQFNEDEYTRITTPRQDVLFKKGYLSRMNNKTASNLSATVNSTESTAASSTITTSDPESSVSTLSPATTPSMDFGQMDSMDYAPPMYYPGYYDENGMLVIPMYNGYNYYPPSSGSTATSPVYLMPYPYQYDPFFMSPSGVQPVDGEENENTDEKTETDGAKENNQNAENQSGSTVETTSSEDGTSSDRGDEKKEETKEANADETTSTEPANPELKQNFPIYPNELNGYMYPTYANGYYNNGGYYYYNGAPASRPPKMRRRKRFLNSRNTHPQQPRSAETTTDYSDDETATHTKRFNPRYQNGWSHHNGYNHYNGKFHRVYMDQNANQAPNEFPLNVDVQEFYPRVQLSDREPETNVNCAADLERKDSVAASPKPKIETSKVTKTSHTSLKSTTHRVSKKEIIEGIKSMEQQNIDLAATKPSAITNASQIDEWNVIKKGKKVKVVKDIKLELDVNDIKKDKIEEIKIEEVKVEVVLVTEAVKKPSTVTLQKSKKSKNKGKKKRPPHMMVKQNGFEIIEPEFNSVKSEEIGDEDTLELSDEEPEITESEVLDIDGEDFEKLVLNGEIENENVVEEIIQPEVNQRLETFKKVIDDDDDAVIDISDEDICSKVVIPIEVLVNEAQKKIEEKPEVIEKQEILIVEKEPEPEVEKTPEVVMEAPEILPKQPKMQTKIIPEVTKAPEILPTPEVPSAIEVSVKPSSETQKTKKPELKLEIPVKPEVLKEVEVPVNNTKEEVIDKEPVVVKEQPEPVKKQPETVKKQPKVEKTPEALPEVPQDPFQDTDFLNDRTNIAALERDLMENLRLLDDNFDLKSPIINPLYDFPITSAVRKWLQEKESESFDTLFHVQNLKKLSELYEDDDDDETESDISEKDVKSETDSDYASDFQAKANGGSPTCSTHAKGSSSKCNKLIAKESFCALM